MKSTIHFGGKHCIFGNIHEIVVAFSLEVEQLDSLWKRTHILVGIYACCVGPGGTNAGNVRMSSNMFQLSLSKLSPGFLIYDYTIIYYIYFINLPLSLKLKRILKL